MLCDVCKFKDDCVDYGWSWCKKFTPKPKPIEEQTNEEWLRSATTEELAEWIYRKTHSYWGEYLDEDDKIAIEHYKWWLKEKRK